MGNKKQPLEAKKKKKGRPSLLDLQKRNLKFEKTQNSNNTPSPNKNNFSTKRSARRNPNPNSGDEEDEELSGKRKEKKLKLVLNAHNGSGLAESGSDLDCQGSRKKRKIENVETGGQNLGSKATVEATQELGPTTALPDKKLLLFILDRLQKKDIYAVFSEPVDPDELPDYHEIIENPMDFGTVRKKLDSGAYKNLEEFEGDVYLISSNAMRYNAPDTIYFRQARAIQELAKKDFDNLRQESDDEEQEPKTARRGRPPIKHIMKRIGRSSADHAISDFSSDATLANAKDGTHNSNSTHDLLRKGSSFDKPSMMDAFRGNSQNRSERNGEYSGSPLKGIPMRNWKKNSVIDENRRNTYNQPLQSDQEPSILNAFDGERKQLMPVGLYMEHAYARSLARFAANLGPIGWKIAAKRIERVLPPGTKFGPGWVGDNELPQQFRPPPPISSPSPSPSPSSSSQTKPLESHEMASNSCTNRPTLSPDSVENGRKISVGMLTKSPLQPCQKSSTQPSMIINGFNPGYGFKLSSQAAKMDMHMTHAHALDMVSRSGGNSTDPSFGSHFAEERNNSKSNFEGQWQAPSFNPKPGSVPPDLNVDFQILGSPVSDSKPQEQKQEQPELALQL